jgi:nucleotide-binding universal stress UspA family protein
MTRNFTRILVPTDFSAPSNAALALAKRMATTSGASLHLIHVLEDPFAAAAYAAEVYAPPPLESRSRGWREHRRYSMRNSLLTSGRRFAARSWCSSGIRPVTSSIRRGPTTVTSS